MKHADWYLWELAADPDFVRLDTLIEMGYGDVNQPKIAEMVERGYVPRAPLDPPQERNEKGQRTCVMCGEPASMGPRSRMCLTCRNKRREEDWRAYRMRKKAYRDRQAAA